MLFWRAGFPLLQLRRHPHPGEQSVLLLGVKVLAVGVKSGVLGGAESVADEGVVQVDRPAFWAAADVDNGSVAGTMPVAVCFHRVCTTPKGDCFLGDAATLDCPQDIQRLSPALEAAREESIAVEAIFGGPTG